MKNFLYILGDSRCYICGSVLKGDKKICDECFKLFKQDIRKKCPVCGHPMFDTNSCVSCNKLGTIYFDSYNFVQLYYNYCKQLVVNCKKNADKGVIGVYYSLLENFEMIDRNIPVAVVPDNPLKRYYKGGSCFGNIATLLKNNGYYIEDTLLRKRFFTGKQKLKSGEQRRKGVNHNFYLNEGYADLKSEAVTLLDDIYTTGATVNCCAKLLKEAGYKKVYVVTLFRAYIDLLN